MTNYTFWLRDTYGRIEPQAITEYYGPKVINDETEFSAYLAVTKDMVTQPVNQEVTASKHFITGDRLMGYLYRQPHLRDQVITLVLLGLRDKYLSQQTLLDAQQNKDFRAAYQTVPPFFHNIFEYPSIQPYGKLAVVNEYQLLGDLTQYDVLHLPVEYFLQQIKLKQPLTIRIPAIDSQIVIAYEPYDFWDEEYQRLIETL